MRNFLLYFFLLFCILNASGQTNSFVSPYRANFRLDGPLIGGGALIAGTSIYIGKKVIPYTDDELGLFDVELIPRLDRWAARNNSPTARKVSDILLYSSFVVPFSLLAGENSRRDFDKVALFAFEAELINISVTNVAKTLFKRPRPYLYHPDVPIEYKRRIRSRYSFFSGHTSTVACFSYLTAKMYSDYYPDSDLAPVVWGLAISIPAVTGYNRMKGGRHYFTDVFTGYLVGAAIGLLIPAIHK